MNSQAANEAEYLLTSFGLDGFSKMTLLGGVVWLFDWLVG
jgi:hypothetical protein